MKSNCDNRYSQDRLLKNCSLPELWRCFLLKHTTEILLVYVIGGSVVLFGKNRVLKLAVVNKIVQAQRVQFGIQRPISESLFFPNSTTDPPITS